MDEWASLVKNDFDFGWKKWKYVPETARFALEHQMGDILDIGCATCQLYSFLKKKGWIGNYYGVDAVEYKGYNYPDSVNLTIGNALDLEFPRVDTVVLYDILEHVDRPITLLKKSIDCSRHNVLISVPRRNEELWALGVVEFHQLDKSHKHCGFSKEEVHKLVDLSGGEVHAYREYGALDASLGVNLWKGRVPKAALYGLKLLFSSRSYCSGILCEVVKHA